MSPRPSKRQLVLSAAVEVFCRHGYARTTMLAVAAEAGVVKQTVYNNFATKEELFAAVIDKVFESSALAVAQLLNEMPDRLGDPSAELSALGVRWAELFLEEQPSALRRLVVCEAPHREWLLQRWVERGVSNLEQALAQCFERWASRGDLDIEDATQAARQFRLLVTTPVWNESAFGTRRLNDGELAAIVEPNVALFVRATATGHTANRQP